VAELEMRMKESLDAYRDPWLEGREPVTTGQFADPLPLIPLPQVPVR
jgi:nitrite reductase (NADH) large subunit